MSATNVSPKWISVLVLCLALLAVPAPAARAGDAEHATGLSADSGAAVPAGEEPSAPTEGSAPLAPAVATGAASAGGIATAQSGSREDPCVLVSCECSIPAHCALYTRIPFHVDYSTTGNCIGDNLSFYVDFGDGHSTYHNDDSHAYHDGAGSYHWIARVGYGGAGGQEVVDEGDITITQCQLACSVTASPVRRQEASVTVIFQAWVNETGCECIPYDVRYEWQFFCNGVAAGASGIQNPTFTFTGPLPHTWHLIATKPNGEPSQCENTGAVGGGCLTVGNLKLCADDILKEPNSEFYTLKDNVKIGGVLLLDSNATFEGDPASGTGVLQTDGKIQVRLANSTETLLQGPGLSFNVDGTAKTLTPTLTGGPWAASLAGLPFWVSGKPITLGAGSVKIEPTLYIGNAGLTLASFKATVLYMSGGDKQLVGFEVIQGQISPGIQFFGMSGTYDPINDLFTGSVSVGFPFMGTWYGSATIRIKSTCSADGAGLNGFDIAIGLPELIPLGTTGLGIGGFVLKVDNICDIPQFFIFFGGALGIEGVPGEVFLLSQMGVGYQRPYLMVLEGGTAYLLGFPMGSLSGRISFRPGSAGITFMGWVNFAGIYQANVRSFLSVSKKTVAGGAKGSLQIPDFSCSWVNVPCRTMKAALTSVASLPIVFAAQEMDMFVSADHGQAQGMFRGMQTIGPLTLAIQLQYGGGEFDLLVGPNYADVFGIGTESVGDPRGVEKSVTLPAPQSQALFAVAANSESSALPSIYLKTPMGATITPATVGGFPGVHYTGDNGLKVALFRLDEASAGTWTLGVDNLSAADVTFQCLVPVAAPATTFTSVTPGSGSVAIHASVSPASPDTKVSFYFSDEASGGMGEPFVQDLSATSGTVNATWDTSHLTGGTYYLFARTDDGKNPPVVTYYSNPITVGAVSIQPPSNLSGTLSGTSCDLQWTASPSAGVQGYRVLYTDSPAAPGYAFTVTAPAGTSARVEGLAVGGQYRFAVVAFDENGNDSAVSEPWYTGAPPPQDVRQIESGKAVSDSVSQNAWKYFKIAVPAQPASLHAWTGGGSGDVDLYLKKGAKPGASDYDYRSNGATGAEKISVTTTSQPRPLSEGDWYLGVFGKQAATFSVGAAAQGASTCAVTCAATVPTSAQPAASVAFQASASLDQCQAPVAYTWSFGDTTPNVTEQNPAHAYLTDGDYTWILTAVSGDSACVKSGEIRIGAGSPCTLDCSATVPATAAVNAPVSFDSYAIPSHCTGTPAFSWTFGDGQTSDQQSPSHTYPEAGSFGWSLTVTTAGTTPCTKGGTVRVGGKPGDCDGNDTISIGEVQKAINMFLGTLAPGCGVDCNGDGTISIGEVQKVINGFLGVASSC